MAMTSGRRTVSPRWCDPHLDEDAVEKSDVHVAARLHDTRTCPRHEAVEKPWILELAK
jgi:hypothetical protein